MDIPYDEVKMFHIFRVVSSQKMESEDGFLFAVKLVAW